MKTEMKTEKEMYIFRKPDWPTLPKNFHVDLQHVFPWIKSGVNCGVVGKCLMLPLITGEGIIK
jgi:hypothetical protein